MNMTILSSFTLPTPWFTPPLLSLALGKGLKIITGFQLPLTVYGDYARLNFDNTVNTTVLAAVSGCAIGADLKDST